MTPHEAFIYAWNVARSPCPHLEHIIAQDSRIAASYAAQLLSPTRFTSAEPIIMSHPESAVSYAMAVLHRPWPEAEPTIMKCAQSALFYAIRVLGRRWLPGEPAIRASKDLNVRDRYLKEWPHAWDEWVAFGHVQSLDL